MSEGISGQLALLSCMSGGASWQKSGLTRRVGNGSVVPAVPMARLNCGKPYLSPGDGQQPEMQTGYGICWVQH